MPSVHGFNMFRRLAQKKLLRWAHSLSMMADASQGHVRGGAIAASLAQRPSSRARCSERYIMHLFASELLGIAVPGDVDFGDYASRYKLEFWLICWLHWRFVAANRRVFRLLFYNHVVCAFLVFVLQDGLPATATGSHVKFGAMIAVLFVLLLQTPSYVTGRPRAASTRDDGDAALLDSTALWSLNTQSADSALAVVLFTVAFVF